MKGGLDLSNLNLFRLEPDFEVSRDQDGVEMVRVGRVPLLLGLQWLNELRSIVPG